MTAPLSLTTPESNSTPNSWLKKRSEKLKEKLIWQRETQSLIKSFENTLTPQILRRQAIEHWDGKLPIITGDQGSALLDLDLEDLLTAPR